MSSPLILRDDHILVVRVDPLDPPQSDYFLFDIVCPHAGGSPEKRWGDCALLEVCECDQLFQAERAILAQIVTKLDLDFDPDLEAYDWIDGTWIALGVPEPASHRPENELAGIRLTVQPHEICPKTGLKHQEWEGDITTTTGACGYQEQLSGYGGDLLENLQPLVTGSWPVAGTWEGEEFYLEYVSGQGPRDVHT